MRKKQKDSQLRKQVAEFINTYLQANNLSQELSLLTEKLEKQKGLLLGSLERSLSTQTSPTHIEVGGMVNQQVILLRFFASQNGFSLDGIHVLDQQTVGKFVQFVAQQPSLEQDEIEITITESELEAE